MNSLSFGDKFHIFHSIASDVNISKSIYPPLKRIQRWNPHKITFRTGGQVPSQHYTNQNNRVFYSPLGQIFCISYPENLEYLLNSSEFPTSQSEWNTPCIQAVSCGKFRMNTTSRNIFILNFSKYRIFTGFYSHAPVHAKIGQ
jgi:hypothetical protein